MSSKSVSLAGHSPLLKSKSQVWRSQLVVLSIALVFTGLGVRAAYVQGYGNAFYLKQGEVRVERTLTLPAHRGRILDRNGVLLATSVLAPSLWANPEEWVHETEKMDALASIMGMPRQQLDRLLKNDDKTFVWLRRQMDEASVERALALKIKGLYSIKEYRRAYPEGETLAQVLGFTGIENQGLEGVEKLLDKDLSGQNGWQRVIKDRMGRVVEVVGEKNLPEDGRDLQLSIDSKIQHYVYQQLKDAVKEHQARFASAVVLDAQTGEILAMANYPSFVPEQHKQTAQEHLRNRAVADVFEPGSTMKPFVAALALEKGIVKVHTPIATGNGVLPLGGFNIKDTKGYGTLTVGEVIEKSSNVGTVKIALQLPAKDIWQMYSQLGVGQRPQGIHPAAAVGRLHPHEKWRITDHATVSYGYSVSASLLQLAQAYTVFSSGGVRLVAGIKKNPMPPVGERLISQSTAAEMRKILHVAASPKGTGQKAQTVGYSVAGKTGTTHKQEGKGYASKKYRSYFVGMSPAEQPRVVVAVMVDEPKAGKHYGGEVAAPVFSRVVGPSLRLLGVMPDQSVQPTIVAQAVEESI